MSVRWVPDPEGEFAWTEDQEIMGLFRDQRGYVVASPISFMEPPDCELWTRVKPDGWFAPVDRMILQRPRASP